MRKKIESVVPRLTTLPDDEEIIARIGFPSVEEEKKLKQLFFEEYSNKIAALINQKLPKYYLSPLNLQVLTSFFYSLYLANYILGGQVINTPNLNFFSLFRKQSKIHSTKKLTDWPIAEIIVGTDESISPSVLQFSGKILLPVNYFTLLYPDIKKKNKIPVSFNDRVFPLTLLPVITYSATTQEFAQIAGFEEAHHIFRLNFENKALNGKKNRKRSHKNLIDLNFLDQNKLINYILTSDASHKISYYSLLGYEYVSHLFVAECVKRYMQDVWNSGYKDFHKQVKAKRQKGKVLRTDYGFKR